MVADLSLLTSKYMNYHVKNKSFIAVFVSNTAKQSGPFSLFVKDMSGSIQSLIRQASAIKKKHS